MTLLFNTTHFNVLLLSVFFMCKIPFKYLKCPFLLSYRRNPELWPLYRGKEQSLNLYLLFHMFYSTLNLVL